MSILILALLMGASWVAAIYGAIPTAAQNVVLTAAFVDGPLPLDPLSAGWSQRSPTSVPLTGQFIVTPTGGGSVPRLDARVVANGTGLNTAGVERRQLGPPPNPGRGLRRLGGHPNRGRRRGHTTLRLHGAGQLPDQIWQWRADRDPLAGGNLDLEDIYPGIYADWYPFVNESTFYPARHVGNILVAQNETPVQVLVAGGAGTITPADVTTVYGAGRWEEGRWRLVFSRKLEPSSSSEVPLRLGGRFAISFAAWNGAAGDRDGLKATSSWMEFRLAESPTPLSLMVMFPPAGIDGLCGPRMGNQRVLIVIRARFGGKGLGTSRFRWDSAMGRGGRGGPGRGLEGLSGSRRAAPGWSPPWPGAIGSNSSTSRAW
jgi:hypothetical protein